MELQERFRRTCAMIALSAACRSQDALAARLKGELKLDDKVDLRPIVTRYLNGDVASSGYFEAIHVIFMLDVVGDDYPPHFLGWLDRAFGSYDLCSSEDPLGKRQGNFVRALLAEARMLFSKENEAEASRYPRYEGARHLMLGMAVAIEQRVLTSNEARNREGIEHLRKAIQLFGTLKPGTDALSASDKFHIAHAQHMIFWLLSELPRDLDGMRSTLASLGLGAPHAYEWLARQTGNWHYQINLAELYGILSMPNASEPASAKCPADAVKALVRAIEINPRLGVLGESTGFDGIEEPLDQAPAFQHVLPVLRKQQGALLADCEEVYRQHRSDYTKDQTKGIKTMLKAMKDRKKNAKLVAAAKRTAIAIAAATFVLASANILTVCQVLAKPVF